MITEIDGRTPSIETMNSFEKSDCFRLLMFASAESTSNRLQSVMSDNLSDSERLRRIAKASGTAELHGLWLQLKDQVQTKEERNDDNENA